MFEAVLSIIGPHLRAVIGSEMIMKIYLLGGIGAQMASLAGNSYVNRAVWASKGVVHIWHGD